MDDEEYFELAGLIGQRLTELGLDDIADFGHYMEEEDLLVDTHGADVIAPVWNLLDKAYELFGAVRTLLERDFNIPPLKDLVQEMHAIRSLQEKWSAAPAAKAS